MKAHFKSGLLTDWIQQSEHDICDVTGPTADGQMK